MSAARAVGTALLALAVAAADVTGQEQPPPPAPAASVPDAPADEATTLEAADTERAAGRLDEAESLLREALRSAWSPRLGTALGQLLLQRANGLDATSELMRSLRDGTLGEARALFERAASDEAMRVEATLGRAACLAAAGRIDEAERVLADALKALRDAGGAIDGRRRLVAERVRMLAENGAAPKALELILEARRAGDLDEAGARFEEFVVAAVSKDPPAITAAAVAALAAGADPFDVAHDSYDAIGEARLEVLLHLYSKLLTVRPRDASLLFYRGYVRRRMGDAAGALEDLKPCFDDARIGERAQLNYAAALIRLDRAEEALPLFERLAQPGGGVAAYALDGIWEVAVVRATKHRYADALPLFREIVAKNPTSLRGRIGEPLCLRSLGEYEQAAAAYEAGIAALPEEAQLLNDYALMLRAHGETARALETFERALGAGSPDAGENLGIIAWREKHDPELAARYLARTTTMLIEGKQPLRPRVLFYRELCLAEVAARAPK